MHTFSLIHLFSTCFQQPSVIIRNLYKQLYGILSFICISNKEIYAVVKKPTITETIRLNRLRWFGHVQRMEENRIPKRVLYMNLGTTRLGGRPRNRWQDEVGEDGRIIGGEGWQEKVRNGEEWKKILRMARNRRILHMPM